MKSCLTLFFLIIFCFAGSTTLAQHKPTFNVIGFYTGINDAAHVSFVHEANKWFAAMAVKNNFHYDSTNNWNNMNDSFLSKYQVILFLDTRPDSLPQRLAFEKYMKNGGGWVGFHFSAFALTPSSYPQDWNWYHEEFLRSGEYVSNTWRPTSAILKTENKHPFLKGLPQTFKSSPNEWYRWKNDLRKDSAIKILLAIDDKSFPLGTGPKEWEIWHSGYYPVVWTNKNYRMMYVNMGHNDMDYEGGTNAELSHTFGNAAQDKLILNAVMILGSRLN